MITKSNKKEGHIIYLSNCSQHNTCQLSKLILQWNCTSATSLWVDAFLGYVEREKERDLLSQIFLGIK